MASTGVMASFVRQPSITTCPSRASTAAISRSGPRRVVSACRELEVRLSAAKERRADDDLQRAAVEQRGRAVDGANAAADAAGQPAADRRDERAVVAGVLRGVEIDQLDLREPLELPHPPVHVVGGDGEPFALHQLHDLSALEIDRWNEHRLTSYLINRVGRWRDASERSE